MRTDLVIDVGMHIGKDTEFYISKGFQVIGIEANPELAQQVAKRLSAYVSDGTLRIYNVAIADRVGTTDFWVNSAHDNWGTTSAEFADRYTAFGGTNRCIAVPCMPFGQILDECGSPYYLKVDIEGADLLCLEALHARERPKYVSFGGGLDKLGFDGTFAGLSLLWNLGYRQFKVVNQGLNHTVRCPYPPLEGRFVDARFDGLCSGPFGEEAPGKWLSAEEVLLKCRPLIRDQRDYGMNGRHFRSVWGRCYKKYRRLVGEPVAWWDIHAKLGAGIN